MISFNFKKKKKKKKDQEARQFFALIVLFCDQYVQIRDGETINQKHAQFFKIASKLPQELQMTLSLKVVGLNYSVFKSKILDSCFKKAFQSFLKEEEEEEGKRKGEEESEGIVKEEKLINETSFEIHQ